jgi:DNA-binding GntR family transcriptional regulator
MAARDRAGSAASARAGPVTAVPRPSDAVRRKVLSDEVYERLRAQLVEHVIEPGARMSIDALARKYEVSPTPVREALARLESDGLVVKRPLVGYSATPPLDRVGFDNLFEMRLLLEPTAASFAACDATAEQLQTIASIFKTMSTANPGSDHELYMEFAGQDALFHKTIATSSHNDLLADAIDRLQVHKQFYKDYYYRRGITEKTLTEHQEILRALQERDPDAAKRAMADHIEQSRSRLRPTEISESEGT